MSRNPPPAEDVYYVTRDGRSQFGLNQLLEAPRHLSEVELEAIDIMCNRSSITMGRTVTLLPSGPVAAELRDLPHGLYYVGPDGRTWLISQEEARPDLVGADLDFALATLETGRHNLRWLRDQLNRL